MLVFILFLSSENIPPNTYSAAPARGLPSKGGEVKVSIHEHYNLMQCNMKIYSVIITLVNLSFCLLMRCQR